RTLTTYGHTGNGCPHSGSYTKNTPITNDFRNVRWVDDNTVFALSNLGGSLMRSTDGGATFDEISRQANGNCWIDYATHWVEDESVLPSNPQHMLFLTGYYDRIYLSSNGLTSLAAYRGYVCGDRLEVDPDNPQFMYAGGPGCTLFGYSENGGTNWGGPRLM